MTTGLGLEQSQEYEGDEWWSWSVSLAGSDEELDAVAEVEYTLHPTFSDPVRRIKTRQNRFKLSTEGWGGFLIYARVVKKDASTCHLQHQLRLYYPNP